MKISIYDRTSEYIFHSCDNKFRVEDILYFGCNYQCQNCLTKFAKNYPVLETFTEKIAYSLWEKCEDLNEEVLIFHTGGGEPFYQKDALFDLAEGLQYLAKQGVTTNGSLIPHDSRINIFDTIHISIYHHDPKEYEKYTGHPMQTMIENLQWLFNHYQGKIVIRIIFWDSYLKNDILSLVRCVDNIVTDKKERICIYPIPERNLSGWSPSVSDDVRNIFRKNGYRVIRQIPAHSQVGV